jgi:CubicO group peptidase (beta-lactamase class C family)
MLLTALVSTWLACASSLQRDFTDAIVASRTQIEELFERERIPGGAVAVTSADAIVWQDTFGVADLDTATAVTLETRYRIGSLTKLLTVAALLRLVDQERLELDATVGEHLADFPHGAITLPQLAGHLSGIRHYADSEFLNGTRYESATDSLRKFARDPLLAPPGEKYAYSSYAYDVLGAVIEKVTSKNFDAALTELVLEPLSMTATSFVADARTATFYDASDAGPRESPANDLSDRYPAGAALSTAGDLARLLSALTDAKFLSVDARTAMARSQATADGKPTNVGLAWRIGIDAARRTYLHHGGAVTGGRAFALIYPAERVSVAIVTNLGFARFDQKDAVAIAARFLE